MSAPSDAVPNNIFDIEYRTYRRAHARNALSLIRRLQLALCRIIFGYLAHRDKVSFVKDAFASPRLGWPLFTWVICVDDHSDPCQLHAHTPTTGKLFTDYGSVSITIKQLDDLDTLATLAAGCARKSYDR